VKYLLLLAIVYVAYAVWRNNRLQDAAARRPPVRPQLPQEMVACAQCGLHLPKSEALPGTRGDWYCCKEHRQRAGG
jgi:uncharacterized protein